MRFAAKKLARHLDAFAFGHMQAASGTRQHTLGFFFIAETAITGKRLLSRGALRAQDGQKNKKDTHQDPDPDNEQEQEDDQNQFNEYTHAVAPNAQPVGLAV